MRLSLGLLLSLFFHIFLFVYALFWSEGAIVSVNVDRPVYTVDLISLAPPLASPPPVVEASVSEVPNAAVPVVEATEEHSPAVDIAPVVEAKSKPIVSAQSDKIKSSHVEPAPRVKPKAEPKVDEISPHKIEKKTVVKTKPKVKPKPKVSPEKTIDQLKADALSKARAVVRREESKKTKRLQNELAALKKKEGTAIYAHGGQPEAGKAGVAGGAAGGVGSGLSEVYSLIVGSSIKKHWRYPAFAGEMNLANIVEIILNSEGKIVTTRIIKRSGNDEFDNSTLRAIKETEFVERPRTDRDKIIRINFNSQELSE